MTEFFSRKAYEYLMNQQPGFRCTSHSILVQLGFPAYTKGDYSAVAGLLSKGEKRGMLKLAGTMRNGKQRTAVFVYELIDKSKKPGNMPLQGGKRKRTARHNELPVLEDLTPAARLEMVALGGVQVDEDPAMEILNEINSDPVEHATLTKADQIEYHLDQIRDIVVDMELAEQAPEEIATALTKATQDQLMAELNRRMTR